MRSISATSLAKLAEQHGVEPVAMVKVWWSANRASWYADRTVGDIPGKIISIGEVDSRVTLFTGGQSQAVDVVLDDTDGSIKDILDHHDIHKRPCYIYQWFTGLDLEERFIICKGLISSPIIWKEGDRTVSFSVVSELEGEDVGVCARDFDLDDVSESKMDTTWPLVFGEVANIPAVLLTDPADDVILTEPLAIVDYTIQMQLNVLWTQVGYTQTLAYIYAGQAAYAEEHGDTSGAATFTSQEQQAYSRIATLVTQINELNLSLIEQRAEEEKTSTVRLLNGDLLPGGFHTLEIGGGKFTGHLSGEYFTINSREHPDYATKTDTPFVTIHFAYRWPEDKPPEVVSYWEDVRDSTAAGFFSASAGTAVTPLTDRAFVYVVSAESGTVKGVAAKRRINEEDKWCAVPSSYYDITSGPGGAVFLTFPKPLSGYEGENWSNEVYVSFDSSLSSNGVLSYLATNYMSGYSFSGTGGSGMNFAFFNRQNVIQMMKDIAFQARCALWVEGTTCHSTYLPNLPGTATVTISESDIIPGTLEVYGTDTEDLVTKIVASWRPSYDVDECEMTLTRNTTRYGTVEESKDYYAYTSSASVELSADWWLTRLSTTWKKVRFRTGLNKLQLEPYDPVLLDFTYPYVADSAITGVVEQASYDSATGEISFEIWLPKAAGTM